MKMRYGSDTLFYTDDHRKTAVVFFCTIAFLFGKCIPVSYDRTAENRSYRQHYMI